MAVFRLFLAAAVAVAAVMAGLFVALLVAVSGLIGLGVRRFGLRGQQSRARTAHSRQTPPGDAIDIEAVAVDVAKNEPHR